MRRSLTIFAPLRVLPFLLWLAGNPARAQISAWLDFDGQIKGEATDSKHKDWIEILSFSAGAGRSISTPAGGHRVTVAPSVSEFSLGKFTDPSTPGLFAASVDTTSFPKVTLDLNTNSTPVVRLELENVLLSGYSFSANTGGDRPVESFTLNFTKVTFTYYTRDSKSLTETYDLTGDTSGSGGTDTDGDGMPDSWETLYGLSVGSNDANGDLDRDGLTNLQEFQLGTNPASGTSFFKATLTPSPSTPGSFQLNWNSVAGKTYVIEWSPDLKTPFTAIRTVTASSTSTTTTVSSGATLGFYQVRPQ